MPDNAQSSFRGFKRPRYTQVPDELIDDIMVDLTGAELKVLLYIIRHTFGYGKDSDTISLSQMLSGIRKSDGTIVDRGTGLTKKTLLAAINTLEARQFVLTERRRSQEKGDEPTAYRLHIDNRPIVEETILPLGEKLHQGGGGKTPPHKKQLNKKQLNKRYIFRIFERHRHKEKKTILLYLPKEQPLYRLRKIRHFDRHQLNIIMARY